MTAHRLFFKGDAPPTGARHPDSTALALLHPSRTPDGGDGVSTVRRGLGEAQAEIAVDAEARDAAHDAAVSDTAIAGRIRAGEHQAFRLLFDRYADRLVDFATGFVRSRESAKDVVADVFFGIWRAHADWTPDRVSTYLFTAVRNRCHTHQTRAHMHREVGFSDIADAEAHLEIDPAPSASDLLDAAELSDRVQYVLDTLPPQRKTAATLRWREGLAFDEIAQLLHISENAARLHVSRALKAVRAALGVSA